jgi:malonate decarboxylase delta subunit
MTLACSTAEEKELFSRQRQVPLLWREPAAVEPKSADRNYFISTAGFWSWESPRVAVEIYWRQLCFLMPSSGDKTKYKRTEAGRRIKMEQIEFNYPAKRKVPKGAHVGVVGSGDLEVLLEPAEGEVAHVSIRTSVDGFLDTWKAVLDRFFTKYDGAVRIQINDAGATPGNVQLRLEQAVEVSER